VNVRIHSPNAALEAIATEELGLMCNQIERESARTIRADVLLASVGERGVLCDLYGEDAAGTYHDFMREADGTSEAREFAAHIRPESGPVLELAAGTGRLTVPLLALGLEVTALELSSAMLDTLRKRLADAPADLRERCTVVHGDMTAFALDERFGTVVISPGTIDLLDEAGRPGLYASVREHLAPGGRFLLSLAQSDAVKSESLERTQEIPGKSGRRYVLHARLLPEKKIREITIFPAAETADPFVVCTSRIRVLKADQMVWELEQAGFDVITRTLPAFQEMLLLEATLRSDSYS
jgi:SAM-dependent methyltransferase